MGTAPVFAITKGAAVACTAWVKRAGRHPEMFAAMAAEGEISESYARTLSTWTDKLPPDKRDEADKILAQEAAAGIIHGDLTPECASIVGTVLDALAAPAGAEDERTKEQRYHDALQEAMRRLVARGLLPERAGQPVKALVHISLADLIRLDGSPALLLEGKAAEAAACDASMTPVVTGDVDLSVLDELVRLCVHLDRLRHDGAGSSAPAWPVSACPWTSA